MITIEDKLRMFSNVVLDSAKKDYFYKYKLLEDKFNNEKKEKIDEIERNAQLYIDEIINNSKNEAQRIISNALSISRNEILHQREEIFKNLMNQISVKVAQYCKTNDYLSFLESLLKLSKKHSNNETSIYYFNSKDSSLINKLIDTTIKIDNQILGGFYIIDESLGIKLDYTLDGRINNIETKLGDLLHNLINQAGEFDE
jgi:V/A-type H+-transporting ATPase subunit E